MRNDQQDQNTNQKQSAQREQREQREQAERSKQALSNQGSQDRGGTSAQPVAKPGSGSK